MRKSHRRKTSAEVNLGFQIAPMIDVVFVILLYFMVAAGAVQKENAHNIKLPGEEVASTTETIMPDEISLRIDEESQVYINDEPVDTPQSKELNGLALQLDALRRSSEDSKSEVLMTVYADDNAKYNRIVDVFDALSRARLSKVTFQAVTPE